MGFPTKIMSQDNFKAFIERYCSPNSVTAVNDLEPLIQQGMPKVLESGVWPKDKTFTVVLNDNSKNLIEFTMTTGSTSTATVVVKLIPPWLFHARVTYLPLHKQEYNL